MSNFRQHSRQETRPHIDSSTDPIVQNDEHWFVQFRFLFSISLILFVRFNFINLLVIQLFEFHKELIGIGYQLQGFVKEHFLTSAVHNLLTFII